ncbi:MAG: ATP-binding protein [Synergistaceae bacterium]|nr:ATP-binding protein [Synergistaceae bacterium]
MEDYVVECRNVSKSFKRGKVLDDVCFGVRAGEILVLLGEHGSGKSTLVDILCGVQARDSGVILFSGSPVRRLTPRKARRFGLAVIRQESGLCPNLSIGENIFLGWEATSGRRFKGGKEAKKKLGLEVLQWLGMDFELKQFTDKLPVYQKQLIEIARALAINAKVLILDEPLSSLTAKEIESLFGVLRRLKDEKNIGIVYICHRVDDLLHIADRVAAMQDGSVVKTAAAADFSMEEFISFLGMQRFADSISETRTLAKLLTNTFSKDARFFDGRDDSNEEMMASFQTLSSSLRQFSAPAQGGETGRHRHGVTAMSDFTDAFSVMIDQLMERYEALLLAKAEAEAASKSKSHFLATMSHEIRTPLNAVIGLTEIEMQNNHPEGTRKNLETIYKSGASLLGIIDDILDITKIETGNFDLALFNYDIASLVNDVVQLNATRIGLKDISFELSIDETIPIILRGDKLRIKRVLNNLLSNAFKYTEAGKVTFRIEWERLCENGGARLIFTVSDTGVGIKEDNFKKIFSDYSQLDTQANRNVDGTGLGLSVTKRLVDLMDGAITLESEYGKGSAFTVEITQQIIDETPIGKDTTEALVNFHFMEDRGGGGKAQNLVRAYMPYGRVLIVDDLPTNLDVAKGLMTPYGLTIDFAGSGKEAIEKIREEKVLYDVVFMDHMMPEIDGIEATRVIRNEIETEYALKVPVVALTANALVGNREMFLANGFNDFLAKPIDVIRLDKVLNKWVRGKQSEATLWLAEQAKAQEVKKTGPPLPSQILDKHSVDGIDLSAGLERYGDETVYLGVLRSFVTHTPGLLSILRNLREGSLTEYAITVHGIKGAAYGICASEAGSRAEALERAAKSGDFETVRLSNGAFIAHLESLIAGLTEVLKHAAEASGADKPKERLPEPESSLLQNLLEAAAHFKSSQMEDVMGELEQYEYETGGELITWLKEQMDNLEYDAMRERLEELLKKR